MKRDTFLLMWIAVFSLAEGAAAETTHAERRLPNEHPVQKRLRVRYENRGDVELDRQVREYLSSEWGNDSETEALSQIQKIEKMELILAKLLPEKGRNGTLVHFTSTGLDYETAQKLKKHILSPQRQTIRLGDGFVLPRVDGDKIKVSYDDRYLGEAFRKLKVRIEE